MSDPGDTVASTSDHKKMDVDGSGSTTIEDPCPVCLSNRIEESGIDGCTHTFCYSCITEWLKVSECCPLCKAPVTEVRTSKIVDGQPVIKKMADLKAEAEAARIMAQANEVPMTSERDAVNQQIHIQRAEVHKLIADKARSKKTKAMNDLYRKATSALNQLTALKEEMERLPRRDIIGDIRFRDVVYRQDLIWRQISRPATAVRFNCAMACADPEGLMTRLKPFLLRELKIVLEPRKKPTDQVLTMILTNIQNYEINNPHFENVLLNTRLFQPSCIRLFAHLLYEFCASGLDLSAFDANSIYSLDPAKGPSGRFIPNLLPDSSRTSDPIYINDNEDEDDEDVIVDGQPNGHRSDSSSSDGITNLYNHRACRVRPSQLINPHRHSNSRNRQLPAFVSSFSLLGQLDSFARQHQFAPIAPSIRRVARAPEVISLEDDSAVRDEPRINSIHPSDMNSWMDPSWLNVTGDGGPSTSRAHIESSEQRSSRSPKGFSNFGPELDRDGREGRDGSNRMRDGRKDEKRIDPSWKTENGKKSESRREKRKADERHQKKQRMFMDLRIGSRKNELFYYYDKLNGKEMSLNEMQKVSSELTLFTARINKLAEEFNTKLEEKRASNGNSNGSQDQGDIIDVDEEDEDEDIIHMPDQSAPSSSTFNDTIVIQ